MSYFSIKDFTTGVAAKVRSVLVNTDENLPAHLIQDSAGNEVLGTKTDAKSTATDTTSVSFMSVFKQISASAQAFVTYFGAQADAKSTATDTTAVSPMSVWKQISASVQLMVTALGATALDLGVGTGGSRTLRFAIDSSQVQATVSHDGADSGDPLKVGGRARSSEIAAVANNDRSDFITDLVGKQIIAPYTNPENIVSGAITSAMTGTTSTSLVASPGAGLRNYITTIIVSNSHATQGTDVIIQDGSGGTTLLTIPAAAVYGGAVINLPVPLRQPSTATAIYVANVTTGASTKVSAVGYKGA